MIIEEKSLKFIFADNVKIKENHNYKVYTEAINSYKRLERIESLSDFYVEGDEFAIDVTGCNVEFKDYYFNVKGKDNVIDFSFNIPNFNYNCLTSIKLKKGLVSVSPMMKVDFRETHSLVLQASENNQKAEERRNIINKSISFIFFGLSMNSKRLVNIVIYMFASFGIVDLFIYLNDVQSENMLKFIQYFKFDFDIFFKFHKSKIIEKHYNEVFYKDKAGRLLIDNRYLNDIDVFGLVFIFVTFLYLTKYYLRNKMDFEDSPKIVRFYKCLKSYRRGYTLSGIFFFFFNRLLMYKNLVDYKFAILYGLLDLVIFTIGVFYFLEELIKKAELFWTDSFFYNRRNQSKVKNRYVALLSIMMFLRNIVIIFLIVFLKRYKIVAAIFVNICLVSFAYLTIKAFRVEKNWYLSYKVVFEICMVLIFNIIAFNEKNEIGVQFSMWVLFVVMIKMLLLMWIEDIQLKKLLFILYEWFFREPLIQRERRKYFDSPIKIKMY